MPRYRRPSRYSQPQSALKAPGTGIQKVVATTGLLSVLVAVLGLWRPWEDSTATAKVKLMSASQNSVIPEPIATIPDPPAYGNSELGDHCSKWATWLSQQGAAQPFVPRQISISAPTGADVTVTGATSRVFDSFAPDSLSQILCLRGAGLTPGTRLVLNLSRPSIRPTVTPEGSSRALPIPGSVIDVPPGHTEYVTVVAEGPPRFYEWSLVIHLTVDQREETKIIGTKSHPLRSWLGPVPRTSYDYDVGSNSWRRVSGSGADVCVNLPLSYCPVAPGSTARQRRAPPRVVIDGRTMNGCGAGVEVDDSYNCEIAQLVASEYGAASAASDEAVTLDVRTDYLDLPMSCEAEMGRVVCRSTDAQSLIVAISR